MAFRSELDAMRERAEGADSEVRRLEGVLAAQTQRMERVADIESQLEAARAQIRQAERSPGGWARGANLGPMLLGTVLGGGAMFLFGQSQLAAAREASALDATRRAAEHRALETELDAARADRDRARVDFDDVSLAMRQDLDELRVVLVALSGAEAAAGRSVPASPPPDGRPSRPLAFGRVSHVDGDAPASEGAPCEVQTFERSDECVGRIVCGGSTLHSFGCAEASATRLRGHGAMVTVDSEALGWRVVVAAARPAVTPAAPGPDLPFPVAPRGPTPP